MKRKKLFKFIVFNILLFGIVLSFNVKSHTIGLENKNINSKTFYHDGIMSLEIPDIKLNKLIYDTNSIKNNVNNNLMLIKESTYPWNSNKSNIIIVGHSGNGYNAYFNNLRKLNLGSKIYIHYKNSTYTYILDNIYKIKKDGTYTYDINYNKITLITCDINDSKKQIVYIGKLK